MLADLLDIGNLKLQKPILNVRQFFELRCLADDYLDLETIKYQIAVHTKLTVV